MLQQFLLTIFHVLEQYENLNSLTWHGDSIPNDDIWVKVAGDQRQGSLKATIQIINREKLINTSIFAMAKVPDNVLICKRF